MHGPVSYPYSQSLAALLDITSLSNLVVSLNYQICIRLWLEESVVIVN